MTWKTSFKSRLFPLFFWCGVLLVCLALANPAQVRADSIAFIPGTEDIPLMPALVPLEDGTMRFDTPTGRVVESLAQSRAGQTLSPQELSDFYRQILPGLGWQVDATGFTRAGERLEIKTWPKSDATTSASSDSLSSTSAASNHPTDMIVRFLLSPQ